MNLALISSLIALGHPIVQSLLNKKNTAKTQTALNFKCVHKLEGRRRYKSPLLKGEKFANALKEKITSFNLVKRITTNTVTGSMLLEYDCEENKIDEMIEALNKESAKLDTAVKNKVNDVVKRAKKTAFATGATYAGMKGASMLGRSMGQALKKNSGNKIIGLSGLTLLPALSSISLTGLVGAACITWGGYKVLAKNQIPVGPQLLWLGYKSVESLLPNLK